MILSTSAISTTFKKISLTTAGIASVMALGTTGASAATLINSTVGVGATSTIAGTFTASDTILLNAAGTVDNFAAGGPDGYTTNAAGIVTVDSPFAFGIGSIDSAFTTGPVLSYGALLISNDNINFQQVFASNLENGAGSETPPTTLTRTATLASIFGSGFTSTNSLQFKIQPFSGFAPSATDGSQISSVPSLASVPNVYTLTGSISQAGGPVTDVPEPFTIVGTLIGGTAALRMRKKLKANNN
jgi:hypothetical protein